MPAVTFEKFIQTQQRSAGRSYPEYVKNLKEIGVTRYVVNVADQLMTVYASEGDPLEVPGKQTKLVCADTYHEPGLKAAIMSTQKGVTTYQQFLGEIADAGVHRYEADLENMKIIYYGKDTSNRYEESIPEA